MPGQSPVRRTLPPPLQAGDQRRLAGATLEAMLRNDLHPSELPMMYSTEVQRQAVGDGTRGAGIACGGHTGAVNPDDQNTPADVARVSDRELIDGSGTSRTTGTPWR